MASVRLALLLMAAFLSGVAISSAFFLLRMQRLDQLISTSHDPPRHHGGTAPLPRHEKGSLPHHKQGLRATTTSNAKPDLPASWSIKSCQSSIRNPPERIDVVIPYEYREEADVSLKYELRSFEKSGLLDHVGTVFIIIDTKENAELVEARYRNYTSKMAAAASTKDDGITQLRIIAMDEIKVPFRVAKYKENPKLGKSHYSPYLPGISEYYLLVPDDVVMLRSYTRDIWFDGGKSLPYGHGFGTWRGGKTHGFPNIAELHGVNFLNRCSMRYVIEKFNVSDPNDLSPTAVALGMMKKENLLAGFYSYRSRMFRDVKPHETEFFKECHTNGGCSSPDKFREIFVNIQGEGVSIEYKKSDSLKHRFGEWFNKTFPLPSRFE